jgi:hypothetical protein
LSLVPFTTLSPTLADAARRSLGYCKARYGQIGLKLEGEIDSSISWRPTFHLKCKKFETLAVEVNDVIFPDAIKGAAQDIRHHAGLIRVVQVTPLDVFQNDKDQKRVNVLRSQGFGIMTVAGDGTVVMQNDCAALSQFISQAELDEAIKDLPSALKVRMRTAHATYLINPTKGVQDAGEVVEGLVFSIGKQSANAAGLTPAQLKKSAADLIDTMYGNKHFENHKAALGGARGCLKAYRNPTSHAPKSAKEAAERVKHDREGFIAELRHASALAHMARALGLKARVHG